MMTTVCSHVVHAESTVTHSKQDWINFRATAKYFMITMPKFKKPGRSEIK